jgi:hypothetical protein
MKELLRVDEGQMCIGTKHSSGAHGPTKESIAVTRGTTRGEVQDPAVDTRFPRVAFQERRTAFPSIEGRTPIFRRETDDMIHNLQGST